MNIRSSTLPDQFAAQLQKSPETGMGYQIVTVYLSNGQKYERVRVANGKIIFCVAGYGDIPFDAWDIQQIVLTHDSRFP